MPSPGLLALEGPCMSPGLSHQGCQARCEWSQLASWPAQSQRARCTPAGWELCLRSHALPDQGQRTLPVRHWGQTACVPVTSCTCFSQCVRLEALLSSARPGCQQAVTGLQGRALGKDV